jgi:hypothetical protein
MRSFVGNYEKIHDNEYQYLLKKLEYELRDEKDRKMEGLFVSAHDPVLANTNAPTLGR